MAISSGRRLAFRVITVLRAGFGVLSPNLAVYLPASGGALPLHFPVLSLGGRLPNGLDCVSTHPIRCDADPRQGRVASGHTHSQSQHSDSRRLGASAAPCLCAALWVWARPAVCDVLALRAPPRANRSSYDTLQTTHMSSIEIVFFHFFASNGWSPSLTTMSLIPSSQKMCPSGVFKSHVTFAHLASRT